MKLTNRFEKIWFSTFLFIILATTIFFSWTGTDYTSASSIIINWIVSPISAISGIICVFLVAKGNIKNYYWGLLNAVTYAFIALVSGYYGDALLFVFWFIPTQFIGYFMWKKNLQKGSTTQIKMKKLTLSQTVGGLILCLLLTLGLGTILNSIDNWFTVAFQMNASIYTYLETILGVKGIGAVIDASTEILQIAATVLMLKAFAEQWLLWIITNIISMFMWTMVILSNPTNIAWALPTLVMWIAYLVNSVYGYTIWLKGAKNENIGNYSTSA